MPLFETPRSTPERRDFGRRLDALESVPLWESLNDLIPAEPRTEAVPFLWSYRTLRPLLVEAGALLTVEEAERRALILENPAVRGLKRITPTLYAALQLVLPGETAQVHRHKAAAFRLIIEGNGGYSAVNGERTTMAPGDFVLTPSWSFHEHGNPAADPVIWLDGLDLPLVNMLGAAFTERYTQSAFPSRRPVGDSAARYGANLMPVSYSHRSHGASPIINYPYSRSREILEQLHRSGDVDPCDGVKMRYINPTNGGAPLPTIGAFVQLLPAGFEGVGYQSTDATVYCVVEGRGRTLIGGEVFDWEEHDVFVVPSWYLVTHSATNEAVLFSFSDRPVQEALGLWIERRRTA